MNTKPSIYRMRPVLITVLLALVAGVAWVTPAAASSHMGTGTIKIQFEQWPATNPNSASLDPNKCLLNIPFRGVFSSTIDGAMSWRAVHSDGTKSQEHGPVKLPTPGKEFTYVWSKYVPPNQPYSGWVMIEARGSATFGYKSAKAAFTVQCIPHKADKWPTAPIIVTPGQNQKVSGGNIVVKPYNPWLSHCADGGYISLDWQYLDKATSTWKRITKLSSPWKCAPEGSTKDISGMKPGLYKVSAMETNGKYNFKSDWSAWVTFEIVGAK